MVELTKLHKTLVGLVIDAPGTNYAGWQIEDELVKAGWQLNQGEGPDMQAFGIEVKSRKVGATSPITIGSMTATTIKNTTWAATSISDKCQKIRLVEYDDSFTTKFIVIRDEIYDLRHQSIQKLFAEAYKNMQEQFINGSHTATDYVSGDNSMFCFERIGETDNWAFRLSNTCLKTLKGMSKSNLGMFE